MTLDHICLSQGYLYFDKTHNQIIQDIKKNKRWLIMENLPEYIHVVDTVKLTNLIFDLDSNKCYQFTTIYQIEKDYDKIYKYLDLYYLKVDENIWIFDFDKGTQITSLRKKKGYFEVHEIYNPKN